MTNQGANSYRQHNLSSVPAFRYGRYGTLTRLTPNETPLSLSKAMGGARGIKVLANSVGGEQNNVTPLFYIWRINKEITKTWSLYKSFGFHSYLYTSAFKPELNQNYVLTQTATVPEGTSKSDIQSDPLTEQLGLVLFETGNGQISPLRDGSASTQTELTDDNGVSKITDNNAKWESFNAWKMQKSFVHYDFESSCIKTMLDEEKSYLNSGTGGVGKKIKTEFSQDDPLASEGEIDYQKCFSFSRDYSFGEESYEDWSFVEKRPYDSLVRENLLDVFNTLEDPFLPSSTNQSSPLGTGVPLVGAIDNSPSISYAESSASGSSIPMGVGKKGYIPLDEQLMSDDIQQVYASRLHFQQKLKWFYGLLTTSSLNRHIAPYNTKRGLRSKKLMGFAFLSELEKRLDVQLYRLGWFATIAASRQSIRHKHIGIWTMKDRKNKSIFDFSAGTSSRRGELGKTPMNSEMVELRNGALNYELNKGDIVLFKGNSSTKKTHLLSTYWLKSKESFNNFYKFPWDIILGQLSNTASGGTKLFLRDTTYTDYFKRLSSAFFVNSNETAGLSTMNTILLHLFPSVPKFLRGTDTVPVRREGQFDGASGSVGPVSSDSESDGKQGTDTSVWLLGNKKACLELSSSVIEKALHSTKPEYNYLNFIPSFSLPTDIGETGSDTQGPFGLPVGIKSVESVSMDQVFETESNFAGLHLSNYPLWDLSTPTHLEYHCQSFFFLYKEHPSWMSVKIPETKDRMQNFENYMNSHI